MHESGKSNQYEEKILNTVAILVGAYTAMKIRLSEESVRSIQECISPRSA